MYEGTNNVVALCVIGTIRHGYPTDYTSYSEHNSSIFIMRVILCPNPGSHVDFPAPGFRPE